MTDLLSGLAINELFYREIVAPLLKAHFSDLNYSTALIGWGSDVLGYDDPQSTDHNWGVRFQLFLSEQDYEKSGDAIQDLLNRHLPSEFRGYPTAFPLIINGVSGSPHHNIEVETIERYFRKYLGCNPYSELRAADWLTFSEHKLLGVTSGKVFHDGLNELEPIRHKFHYYPRDIWLYMLAAQWEKLAEEQAFVGRTGYLGDELGSSLIAARQIRNLMKLGFLMERRYSPYSKWFGTAFRQLSCAGELSPIFAQVLQSQDWKSRQEALAQAYEAVARMHNALGMTIALEERATPYFGRPYLVIGDERYAAELRKLITSEEVKSIGHNLGSANQFIDSDDKLNDLGFCESLKELYL